MSKKPASRWIRLTQIGLQMGVTIFLGAQLGKYLDSQYEFGEKGFTILFTILATALSFYSLLKQVNKLNDENP